METKFVRRVRTYKTVETNFVSTCCWTMQQAIMSYTITQRDRDLFIKDFESAHHDWKGLQYCPWCGNQIEVVIEEIPNE